MSEHVARLFAGTMIGWFCAFVVALIYWMGSESVDPGQQYADPQVPCVFVGYIFGTLPGMVIAGLIQHREDRDDRQPI